MSLCVLVQVPNLFAATKGSTAHGPVTLYSNTSKHHPREGLCLDSCKGNILVVSCLEWESQLCHFLAKWPRSSCTTSPSPMSSSLKWENRTYRLNVFMQIKWSIICTCSGQKCRVDVLSTCISSTFSHMHLHRRAKQNRYRLQIYTHIPINTCMHAWVNRPSVLLGFQATFLPT